ncbi:MAG: BMC domain-containing protein, partial [Phycisphaerae bacterium]
MERAALGLIEVHSWTASLAVLDGVEKAAGVKLAQIEINDLYGTCLKLTGGLADVEAAVRAGREVAESLRASCVTDVIAAPS